MPPATTLSLPCGKTVPLRMRRTKGKCMRLSVGADAVELAVPSRGFHADQVGRFLQQQMPWIQQRAAANPFLGQRPFAGTQDWEVPLAGHIVPVRWHRAACARVDIVGNDDAVDAFAPAALPDAARRALLVKALASRLAADATGHLRRWAPTVPAARLCRVRLAHTQRQWGSMSSAGRMSLALALVGVESKALEYVVIHELCHQLHMNHSASFWREVRARCPAYRAQEAYLRRVQAPLHGLLARLMA